MGFKGLRELSLIIHSWMACLGTFREMDTRKAPITNVTRSKVVCCCTGECTGVPKDSGRLYPYVKASQIAVGSPSPSPSRNKSYELEVRDLSYKIVKLEGTPKGMLESVKAEIAQYRSKPTHYVLKHVTCTARPGEILAIAGPSGAGKSTLLEVLAGRIQPSSPSSSILVNGLPMDMQRFRRISGYVMQDDALFPMLTVRETLLYSARLRLPSSVPTKEKILRVEALMTELGLSHVANTRIGNESVRGVSGGERRRVSIGVDVIHDPAVLILDEPTSGLDSTAALHVVAMLRKMAVSHNRTIILSIHQPGYQILQLIHAVLLIAHGSVVHDGPLDLLSSRLAAAGHLVPPQVNVLEYAIDAVDSLNSDQSGILLTNGNGKENNAVPNLTLQDLFQLDPSSTHDPADKVSPSLARDQQLDQKPDKVTFANSSTKEVMFPRFYPHFSSDFQHRSPPNVSGGTPDTGQGNFQRRLSRLFLCPGQHYSFPPLPVLACDSVRGSLVLAGGIGTQLQGVSLFPPSHLDCVDNSQLFRGFLRFTGLRFHHGQFLGHRLHGCLLFILWIFHKQGVHA